MEAVRRGWTVTGPFMSIGARMGVFALALAVGMLGLSGGALAALPDGRGYELVSPVVKNGVSPFAAVPSVEGGMVDFQARGAFAGATSGSENLYQATRSSGGWQTVPLTPTPSTPLGALEEQAPVWFSADLSQTIFTTPGSYASGDSDGGALDLYLRSPGGGLTWLSQGSQGGGEPKEVTFDGATPDASHVVFSTGEPLLPAANGLDAGLVPEPEFLYDRVAGSQTNLVDVNSNGRVQGYAATRLSAETPEGAESIVVESTEGFLAGQTITIGSGASAETMLVSSVPSATELRIQQSRVFPQGLRVSRAAGTAVVHFSGGAVLGNGTHLTSGAPPAGEFVAADADGGSTTNAISKDGSKIFFESLPLLTNGESVGLYMREGNSRTVQIASSARYEGASADGSLVFFTTEEEETEGETGSKRRRLYEFNTTSSPIGPAPAMSAIPLSTGLNGDKPPKTELTAELPEGEVTSLAVANTAGFAVGETIYVVPVYAQPITLVITAVMDATHLAVVGVPFGVYTSSFPAGASVMGTTRQASLTAVSNDGSEVYFVSTGVLASNANSQGATAAGGDRPNLYVFDTQTGVTTFIAALAEKDVSSEGSPTGLAGEPDISRPAVPTPDGGVLVFASAGNLTGQNPWEEYTEIYRYSVAGNSLTCVSCTAPGVQPTGNATFGETAGGTYDPPGLSSPMNESGSEVFFDTPDSLVGEDGNGGAPAAALTGLPGSTDVYQWENGRVYLISSGTSSNPAVLQGVTPSGDDVLFTTNAVLAPQDTDGGYENVWDARVGGGFPAEAGGAPSCVGEGCRAVFGTAPVLAASGSTGLSGSGNLPAPQVVKAVVKSKAKTVTCGKGSVKKRVQGREVCVRRKKARKASRARAGRVAVKANRSR